MKKPSRVFVMRTGANGISFGERYLRICMNTENPEKPTANPVTAAPYIPPISAPRIAPDENSNVAAKKSLIAGTAVARTDAATRKNTINPVTARHDEAASVTALQNAGTAFG